MQDSIDRPDRRDLVAHLEPAPQSLGTSHRSDSTKKMNVRTKPPILFEKVLKEGETPEPGDMAGLHQRKAEKIMRNRASARRSNLKKKQEKKELAAEALSLGVKNEQLQAKMVRLEKQISLLTSASRLDIRYRSESPKEIYPELVDSRLDPRSSSVYHGMEASNTVTANCDDFETPHSRLSLPSLKVIAEGSTLDTPKRVHAASCEVGVEGDFTHNFDGSGDVYSSGFIGPFVQAPNVFTTQTGTYTQASSDRQDPVAVEDMPVFFCECLYCATGNGASVETYRNFSVLTQQAMGTSRDVCAMSDTVTTASAKALESSNLSRKALSYLDVTL